MIAFQCSVLWGGFHFLNQIHNSYILVHSLRILSLDLKSWLKSTSKLIWKKTSKYLFCYLVNLALSYVRLAFSLSLYLFLLFICLLFFFLSLSSVICLSFSLSLSLCLSLSLSLSIYIYIYIYVCIIQSSKSRVGNNSVRTIKLFKIRISKYSWKRAQCILLKFWG